MDDIIRMAREAGFTIEGKHTQRIHGYDRDGDYTEEIERLVELVAAAKREQVAAWMMAQGYATGHGDTIEGLLEEFKREASFDKAELWIKRINDAVLSEREACAKACEDYTDKSDADHESHGYSCAAAIRARGNT